MAGSKRHSENNLCAPMCFSCARVLPYDQYYVDCVSNEETSQQPTIQWRKVMERDRFCNMTKNETQAAIGMDSYIKEYGQSPDLTTSTAQKELSAWTLSVPFEAGSVDILCCPEDRKCTNDPDNKEGIASSSHALGRTFSQNSGNFMMRVVLSEHKLRILTGGPRSQLEATFFMAAFPFLWLTLWMIGVHSLCSVLKHSFGETCSFLLQSGTC